MIPDDVDMTEWLVLLKNNSREHFLSALSEAVMKADRDEYSIIRPALMELKRKYFSEMPRVQAIYTDFAASSTLPEIYGAKERIQSHACISNIHRVISALSSLKPQQTRSGTTRPRESTGPRHQNYGTEPARRTPVQGATGTAKLRDRISSIRRQGDDQVEGRRPERIPFA